MNGIFITFGGIIAFLLFSTALFTAGMEPRRIFWTALLGGVATTAALVVMAFIPPF